MFFFDSEDMEKHNELDKKPLVDNATDPHGVRPTSQEAEQFVDLSSDLNLKSICNPNSPNAFWVKKRSEFQHRL